MFLKDFVFVFLTLYGLVKYLPMPFGNLFRGAVLKLYLQHLGKKTWIRDGVTVWWPGNIRIGSHSSINEFVFLNGRGGIEIGDYVMIAHFASVISEDHGIDRTDIPMRQQMCTFAKVVIEDDVWVGAGARILKGVRVGKGAVIGSNAVVTKDVPPYAIAVGVPARVLKYRGPQESPAQALESAMENAVENAAKSAESAVAAL